MPFVASPWRLTGCLGLFLLLSEPSEREEDALQSRHIRAEHDRPIGLDRPHCLQPLPGGRAVIAERSQELDDPWLTDRKAAPKSLQLEAYRRLHRGNHSLSALVSFVPGKIAQNRATVIAFTLYATAARAPCAETNGGVLYILSTKSRSLAIPSSSGVGYGLNGLPSQ
jgi:hypothetical protein